MSADQFPAQSEREFPLGRRPMECPGQGCRCTNVCGVAVQEGRVSVTPALPEGPTWQDHEREVEHRAANDGFGMCNTGSGLRCVCVLGGIGCNVDHNAVARANSHD